jgi:ABC-type Fe3+ transport system substrate-binding protein
MKGAPQPGAAKLFSGWLASSAAQKILNTGHFMGTLGPKSTFAVAQELDNNKVAVIKETLQNYRQAGDFTELAMMTLGAIK